MWQHWSPLAWGGGIRSCGTCGGTGALPSWEAGFEAHLGRGCELAGGANILFPRVAFLKLVPDGFEVVVRFHQRTRGNIYPVWGRRSARCG
jgi:hypothetical protein